MSIIAQAMPKTHANLLKRTLKTASPGPDAPPPTRDQVTVGRAQPPATAEELKRAAGLSAELLALRALPGPRR